MTPYQFGLLRDAEIALLAHRDFGRKCDPEAVKWAETLLAINPDQSKTELAREHP